MLGYLVDNDNFIPPLKLNYILNFKGLMDWY